MASCESEHRQGHCTVEGRNTLTFSTTVLDGHRRVTNLECSRSTCT